MKSRSRLAFLYAVFLSFLMFIPQSMAEDWLYTVRKGDTIWGLSHKYLKDPLKFKDIQEYNNVKFDRQIPPGVTLKFPMEYLKFAPAEVSVLAINGLAHFVRRGVKEELSLEHKLVLDDILVTEKDSSVALLFADGSELLLGESSELIFDVQTKWGETGMVDSRMRLMKGSAEGRVKPLIGPGANFEVETPSAVATVRGTAFRVRVDDKDTGTVFNEVDEGTVAVQLHENRAMVEQGFGLKTSTNRPMTQPKALLPKPVFVNPQDKYPGHPVTITWQPIDGAKNYQVELFSDAAMTQLVHKETITENQVELPSVALDDYSFRVRAIDNEGLQGLNNSKRFTISPVPGSPQTVSFRDEYKAGEAIAFSWKVVEGTAQYRWQLAKDRQFSDIVVEEDLSATAQNLKEGLPAGTYYWRVAAGNQNGFGRYSSSQKFEVTLPSPPVLEPLDDEVDADKTLSVRWSQVDLATEYHWQISRTPDFSAIVEEGKTLNTQVSVDGLPEQQLYIRVAAIGPYNNSRFSEPATIDVVEPSDGKTAFSIGSVLLFILLL